MDFHSLPRRDLQSLCKMNKIPANMTNIAMADALQALSMVEGLDAVKESLQGMSPKTAGRRTSAVGKSNPAGSSLARARRGTVRMAASMKDENVASEIPNSPTTLSARGRRTRTVVDSVVPEEEEDDGKNTDLELLKTPVARPARGRRAAAQVEKSSIGEQAGSGDAVALRTPAASTARRASTRRITRSAAQLEEANGARTSRYRTRMSSRKAAADQEAPAMETETVAKGYLPAINGSIATKEDGAEDDNSPAPETMNGKMAEQEEPFVVETVPSDGLSNQTAVEDFIAPTVDTVEEDEVSDGPIDPTVEEISAPLDSDIDMDVKGDVDPAVHQIEVTAIVGVGDTPEDGEAAENLTAVAEATADAVSSEEAELDGGGLVEDDLPIEVAVIVSDGGSMPSCGEAAENLTAVAEAAAVTPEELDGGGLAAEGLTAGVEAEQKEPDETQNPAMETENLMVVAEVTAAAINVGEEQDGGAAPVADGLATGEVAVVNAAFDLCVVLQDKENSEALEEEKQQRAAAAEYNGATSLRKLKAAVKEKLQAMEEKKKRAALATLDDNCIFSPGRLQC